MMMFGNISSELENQISVLKGFFCCCCVMVRQDCFNRGDRISFYVLISLCVGNRTLKDKHW